MKNWDIHLNLGTYWTVNKHVIGNTQMLADFLEINDIFNPNLGKMQYDLGMELGSFVASIREGLSQVIRPPMINRHQTGINIEWFYDLNTYKYDVLYISSNTGKILLQHL